MRKLASVQKISSLTPIEGADTIEKATVLGWQLVVKKNEFQVGDLVVYCEIDSILPDKPEFEFLKPRGMRIKTIKLRGQVSQGICFPLSVLPDDFVVKENADCTEVLNVVKYEPAVPTELQGIAKGKFPSFIPKTDETRVQVLQKLLDKYKGELCYVTEKLDGSSVTCYIKDDVFGVCSRNLDLLETEDNSFWQVVRSMNVERKMRNFLEFTKKDAIAIQGELIGPGIQGNKLNIKEKSIRFFNIFDINKFEYGSYNDLINSFYDILDLPLVPIIESNYHLENDVETIIAKATIKSFITPNVWAEGIVIRPLNKKIDLLLSNENFNNGRVSFKAINPNFLLKYE